jgi:recombination protein RecT
MSELTVFNLVENQEELFLPVISDQTIKWEKEKQFAIQALQGDEYLTKIAFSNQSSFQNAIINVASIGISLNPANKHAYLVPRDGRVCLDISYMGLLHLAMSTGAIKWGQCKLVNKKDTYQSNGLDKAPTHTYEPFGDRGKIIGAYCTVKTADGDYLTDEMSLAEIEIIMRGSKSFNSKYSPWKTYFSEMARKTVVKRASKYWPTVDRLDNAIHHLNTDNDEGLKNEKDVTPEFIENPIQVLKDMLIEREAKESDYLAWLRVEKFEDVTEEIASKAVITLRAGAQK